MSEQTVRLKYVGPHAEGVEIVDTGQMALPGEHVEVPRELAERLLVQPHVWQPVKGDKPVERLQDRVIKDLDGVDIPPPPDTAATTETQEG